MPLVSVLATLCFLLAVAGAATWYRYRLRQRSRAGLPFWSIELQEDKAGASSGQDCPYQHLNAASSNVVVQTCAEGYEASPTPTFKTFKAPSPEPPLPEDV